jgi:hypothetical protein
MAARWSDPRLPDPLPDLKIADELVRVQGNRQALVASHTAKGDWHSVEAGKDGVFRCSCRGYEIRKRCRHASAVQEWYYGRFPAEVVSPEARARFTATTKGDT